MRISFNMLLFAALTKLATSTLFLFVHAHANKVMKRSDRDRGLRGHEKNEDYANKAKHLVAVLSSSLFGGDPDTAQDQDANNAEHPGAVSLTSLFGASTTTQEDQDQDADNVEQPEPTTATLSKAAKRASAKAAKATSSEPSSQPSAQPSTQPSESSQPSSEPSSTPTTVIQLCGEDTFTNEKVSLSEDLICDDIGGFDQCAIALDGPEAELNCNDFMVSQANSDPNYFQRPFWRGICVGNGAKVTNCKVEQFLTGIHIENGAEVMGSAVTSNFNGIRAEFLVDSNLMISDSDASNNDRAGLNIVIKESIVEAKVKFAVKGEVTFDSNGEYGINTNLGTNTNLEIVVEPGASLSSNDPTPNSSDRITPYGLHASVGTGAELRVEVEEGGTFKSCGHTDSDYKRYDIQVVVWDYNSTATFLGAGDGYTCDSSHFFGDGTVVGPDCQDCPSP